MSGESPGKGGSTGKLRLDCREERGELFTWEWPEQGPGVWGSVWKSEATEETRGLLSCDWL